MRIEMVGGHHLMTDIQDRVEDLWNRRQPDYLFFEGDQQYDEVQRQLNQQESKLFELAENLSDEDSFSGAFQGYEGVDDFVEDRLKSTMPWAKAPIKAGIPEDSVILLDSYDGDYSKEEFDRKYDDPDPISVKEILGDDIPIGEDESYQVLKHLMIENPELHYRVTFGDPKISISEAINEYSFMEQSGEVAEAVDDHIADWEEFLGGLLRRLLGPEQQKRENLWKKQVDDLINQKTSEIEIMAVVGSYHTVPGYNTSTFYNKLDRDYNVTRTSLHSF